jgi:hypothetical protein
MCRRVSGDEELLCDESSPDEHVWYRSTPVTCLYDGEGKQRKPFNRNVMTYTVRIALVGGLPPLELSACRLPALSIVGAEALVPR